MPRYILIGMVSVFALLTACGGSSDKNSNFIPISTPPRNVAEDGKIIGATISPESASNLIDGDFATSVLIDSSTSVLIDLKKVHDIKEFTLSRLESAAGFGNDPDILIELSENGKAFYKSNVSLILQGLPCASFRVSNIVMQCEMAPAEKIRYVRISVKEGLAYNFTEFEAIADVKKK